ncbi:MULTISPECIES: hypothetical protein [Bacillus amyloliquefaciens group]|uniref:hypothetical protein n=1 Tax=Bacillus amyloliquefaciens group TaxID=1938374 RepID=UPI0009F50352|nr:MULTISPECIES: hypothetical protein [Bacillus amyloliquefaciens group]MEB4597161.1 hypothetical protein [Bacillus amyloliquefaciens]OQV46365.1 hypothetical protein B5Z20_18375 [Bacillus velezensis]OQV47602.1 hypothetical protein B5Z22_18385 [Bacillus velezensis]OQV57184.1 hypothetical protein B5Z24_17620 [Bacillus velezensis]OQV57962.1 hypothetical protein B5Z23_17220 [Bacillus velezensis]
MTEERKETLEEERQHQGTDEEPLSRMSRKAGRYQKQKKKEKERRPAPAFTEKLASAWAAVKRYCRFALRILTSPVKVVGEDGFSRFKYALISMLVFSIFFSIGNWFQLRASQQRPLGYGERHHTFFDGFTVVLVYTLVFFAAAAGAVWLVSRYMMKQKITMRDAAAGVGSLLVPAVACSIVWMIFAILNLPVVTVVFTALTLFLAASAMVQFVQILYKSAEKPAADVMYCISAAVIIMLIFTAVTWPLISEYFTASLIPL